MNPFINIAESFGNMIRIGDIDVTINEDLGKLGKKMDNLKRDVINKDVPVEEGFALFFSLDVQQKILKRMIERVKESKITMENPKAAKQIMTIIPMMSDIYYIVEEYIKRKEVLIKDKLIKLSIDLQNLALDQDLFIRKEDSIARIQKRNIKRVVNNFALDVGGHF